MSFGLTHLQWFPGDDRPVSRTEYTYLPMAPSSIGISVGPSSLRDQSDDTPGDAVLTEGEPRVIGGRSGWVSRIGDQGIVFSYRCGEIQGESLWCLVRAATKFGEQVLHDFVASIQ